MEHTATKRSERTTTPEHFVQAPSLPSPGPPAAGGERKWRFVCCWWGGDPARSPALDGCGWDGMGLGGMGKGGGPDDLAENSPRSTAGEGMGRMRDDGGGGEVGSQSQEVRVWVCVSVCVDAISRVSLRSRQSEVSKCEWDQEQDPDAQHRPVFGFPFSILPQFDSPFPFFFLAGQRCPRSAALGQDGCQVALVNPASQGFIRTYCLGMHRHRPMPIPSCRAEKSERQS